MNIKLINLCTDSNRDVHAFYLCYYRYIEPSNIIGLIKHIWSIHCSTFWPAPYCEVVPEIRFVYFLLYHSITKFIHFFFVRLFYFLKEFIKSPFVLTDKQQEFSFRLQLAELYSQLVPSPIERDKTSAKLINLVQVCEISFLFSFSILFIIQLDCKES